MMKRYFVGLITFVCLFSLFFLIGCGDPEDTDSIVIPSELYDTSQLTYDISDAEIQELMALGVPTNWNETEDRELRAKYYHATSSNNSETFQPFISLLNMSEGKQKHREITFHIHLTK